MKINLELESFTGFIEMDGSQYTLVSTVYFAVSGKSKNKTLGHFKTLDGAIKRAASYAMANSQDQVTLSQFLIKYQSIVNQLESLVNIEA